MTADTKPTIVEALISVMADVQAVAKNDRNTSQNYNFRGIDAVVNAVGPVLRKHSVVVLPHKTVARYRDAQTSTGKSARECTLDVTYRFYGPAGDWLEAEVPGESLDFGDKGAPKAMSVAYRICLLQALCIPTDDIEPDAQSYERVGTPAKPPAETDEAWYQDKVEAVPVLSLAGLEALTLEARTKLLDGSLTSTDARSLKARMDTRKAELEAAVVA